MSALPPQSGVSTAVEAYLLWAKNGLTHCNKIWEMQREILLRGALDAQVDFAAKQLVEKTAASQREDRTGSPLAN
jgi:hypothetical protein